MNDQIINAAMARSLHEDALRTRSVIAWVVMRDPPQYPDKVVARLTTEMPTSYVLVAHTLAEIHEALPPALKRAALQPGDPPDVVEVWLAA